MTLVSARDPGDTSIIKLYCECHTLHDSPPKILSAMESKRFCNLRKRDLACY